VSVTHISIATPVNAACTANTCTGSLSGNVTTTGSISLAGAFLKPLVGGSDGRLFVTGTPMGAPTFSIGSSTHTGAIILLSKFSLNQITLTNFVPYTADWSSEYVAAISNSNFNPKVYDSSDIAANGLGSTVTVNNGGTDSTAPTCTGVTYSSQTLTTTTDYVSVDITAACTDNVGGVGIAYTAVIVSGTQTAGITTQSVAFSLTANVATTFNYVPPYFTGQFAVIGVIAVDNSGNTALYGSCGTSTDFGQLCPGAGSSATSVLSSVSAFVAVLVVVINLVSM